MKEKPDYFRNIGDDPPDKLYTTEYVADLFSVTQETVRNWIARGDLEGILVFRTWRVPRRALLAFANSKYGNG